MSRITDAFHRVPTTPWSVWKFNWLINHKLIAALRRGGRHAHGTLLDIGCGTRAFAPYLSPRVTRYLGIDLPTSRFLGASRPDVYARGEMLPFRDASMDTVLGLSIMTYFPEPSRLLDEAHRVLRPGGILLLEFPQMMSLLDPPNDYLRFTRYGAAWLLVRSGFTPVEIIPFGGLWSRVGLMLIAGINRVNHGPLRILTEIPARLLYIVLQLGFELLDRLFLTRDEVVSHVVVARRNASGVAAGG